MRSRWVRRLLPVGVFVLVLSPGVAAAHPLGLPAFAQISLSERGTVDIAWNASPDDVAALARTLDVDVAAGRVLSRAQDAALSDSPALRTALLESVTVVQDGEACRGQAEVVSLVEQGARWVFDCPAAVTEVDITIRLLTDIDQRYRTLATAATPDGPMRLMFTSTNPTQRVALDTQQTVEQQPPPALETAGSGRQVFGGSLPFESEFVALIDRSTGAAGLALGLLVALGVGALHGFAPGHGKAIAAAYLVGDRGKAKDAVLLGLVVALMHTWSVLALGYALYLATQRPATAALSAWLQLVSGVIVALLGAWMVWRRSRERRAANDHDHDHSHAHTDADRHPLSWRGLVTLGAAGGLLPSPSALLVVFTALAVGRIAYGLSLIAAFSLGLAITVSVVGLAVLRGRDALQARFLQPGQRWTRLAAALPLYAAGVVLVFGIVVTASAASRLFAAS